MARIVVLDNIAEEGLQLLESTEGVEYEIATGLKGESLREALAGADGAICRSGVTITEDALKGNRRLRAIVRAGVGTDNIDKATATRMGVVVMNTPAGNTLSTAEHTFTMMLALSRKVAPANQSLCEHRWDRKSYLGTQLAKKTLGIVGLGRIGQEVARRAIAFQMKVVGYDPFLPAEQTRRLGIEPVDTVRDMLPMIDYLTVHTPLTPETKHLIASEEIEMLRPGARLINCARGGIYDERALLQGLESGKLAGVALDVFESEPCIESPLFGRDDTICTPHLGASTEEAQTQVAVEGVQLLINYLHHGEIRHAVNMAAIDPKALAELRGYLDTAYRLGLLLAKWHGGGAASCTLSYRGDQFKKNTNLLSAAFCAGLLEHALDVEVNIVNSEMLLRERGVELNEQTSSQTGAFSSSIRAELTKGDRTFSAVGTLFGANMPRLVRLDEYRLEAFLDGNLLIFSHDDVPGIIGTVGTIMGKHEVNIAQMAVGRDTPGGTALGVLNLDSVPSAEILAEVEASPEIRQLVVIEMPPAGALPTWLQ